MRAVRAEVGLAVPEGRWTVHVLAQNGRRRGTVPTVHASGTLTFTANVAADPTEASYLYELVRE